jgi:hypothetical protein
MNKYSNKIKVIQSKAKSAKKEKDLIEVEWVLSIY